MHTNHRIALLIRASRLYCHSMYQEYDPKYYPTIKEVVLNFTNKLFGTKSMENKIGIKINPVFDDIDTDSGYTNEYTGVSISMEFPDESGLEFELFKQPLTPEGNYWYRPKPIPAKA